MLRSLSSSIRGGLPIRRGATAVSLLIALAACGGRTEYLISELDLNRASWDTVQVDVSFAKRTAIGGRTMIQPDSVVVMLFDAAYDSIYVGPPGAIPVPDKRLGDRERVTLEACGIIRARQVCVQDVVRSSPKRIDLDADIEYPTGSDLTKGRYTFSFAVERQQLHEDTWESIDAEDVSGYMQVWVDDEEAREEGQLRVPFERRRGSFDLSTRPNYRDFRFYLDSQMLDEDTAHVHFAVFAGLGETINQLATVRKEVFWKSEDEREEDVRYFVRETAERLVEELGSFLGGRRAVAYVDDWEFDEQRQLYVVEVEVQWEGTLFDRGDYEIEGILEVREDGSNALFELIDANRRGERRWRRRADDRTMRLGELGTPGNDLPRRVQPEDD